MSYFNPLHHPISSSTQSVYSSLGGAMPVPGRPNSSRFRLPQPLYIPTSKLQGGRGAALRSIVFDCKDQRGRGVPMRDLSARSVPGLYALIEGGDDRVFAHSSATQIAFRILWPGYTHIEWLHPIDIAAEGPISRARLAQVIAQHFARFIETNRAAQPTQSDYQIGLKGIRIEHLALLSIQNTYDNSWQADVVVDLR